MSIKHFSIRLDEELLRKFRIIAKIHNTKKPPQLRWLFLSFVIII